MMGLRQELTDRTEERIVGLPTWNSGDGKRGGRPWALPVECGTRRRRSGCRLDSDIHQVDHVRDEHGKERKQAQNRPYTVGYLASLPRPTLTTETGSFAAAASHRASPRKSRIVVAETHDLCNTATPA